MQTLFGPRDESKDIHAGSAQRALAAQPPFDRIVFIEKKRGNVKQLESLIRESGHLAASVEQGDCNQVLMRFCRPASWRNRRGVIFLDPFGMKVDWTTLEAIAATRALDVWYLVSLAGLVRNLPLFASKLTADKRSAVTRMLGTEDWFDEFYPVPRAPKIKTLWGEPMPTPPRRRDATPDKIEAYVAKRLTTIFSHVEPPKRFLSTNNAPLFSLFFALSNPRAAAINLARKGAAHILAK